MKIRDTGLSYGIVTIFNHWIGALLMPGFVLLSVAYIGFSENVQTEKLRVLTTIASLVFILSVFRIYWRIRCFHPVPLSGIAPVAVLVSRCVAVGLLLAGVILPLLLWMLLSASGQGFYFMSLRLADVVSPGREATEFLQLLYMAGIASFIFGLSLHLTGVFKHQFIIRDKTLARLFGARAEI